jgi:hypothetical protein
LTDNAVSQLELYLNGHPTEHLTTLGRVAVAASEVEGMVEILAANLLGLTYDTALLVLKDMPAARQADRCGDLLRHRCRDHPPSIEAPSQQRHRSSLGVGIWGRATRWEITARNRHDLLGRVAS